MASEATQQRIQRRLKEERASLEDKMTKQLEAEKVKLLEKKRQEQEERQRKQLELERILEDNRRLVEDAQKKAAADREQRDIARNPEAPQQEVRARPMGIRVVAD